MVAKIAALFSEGVAPASFNTLMLLPRAITEADRRSGGVVNHIRAAATRLGMALPEGWKPEVARRLPIEWSMQWPEELRAEVLDAAVMLFDEISKRAYYMPHLQSEVPRVR